MPILVHLNILQTQEMLQFLEQKILVVRGKRLRTRFLHLEIEAELIDSIYLEKFIVLNLRVWLRFCSNSMHNEVQDDHSIENLYILRSDLKMTN